VAGGKQRTPRLEDAGEDAQRLQVAVRWSKPSTRSTLSA
jgi:hypothetical protein